MTDERQDAKEIGISQAAEAWDQRHEYDDNEHARFSYHTNVFDTCSEIGQPEDADEAQRAFDAEWAELSGEAFNDAFSALLKCKAPNKEVKELLQNIQAELNAG